MYIVLFKSFPAKGNWCGQVPHRRKLDGVSYGKQDMSPSSPNISVVSCGTEHHLILNWSFRVCGDWSVTTVILHALAQPRTPFSIFYWDFCFCLNGRNRRTILNCWLPIWKASYWIYSMKTWLEWQIIICTQLWVPALIWAWSELPSAKLQQGFAQLQNVVSCFVLRAPWRCRRREGDKKLCTNTRKLIFGLVRVFPTVLHGGLRSFLGYRMIQNH